MILNLTSMVIPVPRSVDISDGETKLLVGRPIHNTGGMYWKLSVTRKEGEVIPRILFNWDSVISVCGVTGAINFVLVAKHQQSDVEEIVTNHTVGVNVNRSGKWITMPSFGLYPGNCMKLSFSIQTIDEQFEKFTLPLAHDAFLLIQGEGIPVNRAHLSLYSKFFNELFGSDNGENAVYEVSIKSVPLESFKSLLELISPEFKAPTVENVTDLLRLSDHFKIPSATGHCEDFLIKDTKMAVAEKIYLADTHELNKLLKSCICQLEIKQVQELGMEPFFDEISDATKAEILHRLLNLIPDEEN